MLPDMTERERLAADLELLGILADPTRGPLASLYASVQPQAKPKASWAFPSGLWRRWLATAFARLRQVRPNRPAHAPLHAKSATAPAR